MKIHPVPARTGLALVLAVVCGAALAASPHFVKGPSASIDNDGILTISWKEAGLGDSVIVDYEASADAHAKYQCVNRGGKCPAASNKEEVFGPVVGSGSFASGKNGSIQASLTLSPPAATLQCPGNQVLKLVSVTYSDIDLHDLTNDILAAADPDSLGVSGPECP
jgi:hypothetical protein